MLDPVGCLVFCHPQSDINIGIDIAIAATYVLPQCNCSVLSVHSLTGAFSCCNFYVYVVIFPP